MSYICSLLLVSYTCRLTLVPYILVSDICVGVNCFSQRRSGRRFREDGVDALQRVLGAEGAFSDGGDAAFRADAEGAFGDACGVAVQVLESQIFLVLPGRELDGGGEDIGTLMLKGIGQWTRCGGDAPAGGEVEAGDALYIAKSGYVGVGGGVGLKAYRSDKSPNANSPDIGESPWGLSTLLPQSCANLWKVQRKSAISCYQSTRRNSPIL